MKKEILIIMPSMFIGGAERSLLGLLESFDYSKVNVSLFLYRHEGEFMKYIPSQVKILESIPEYETFDVSIKSLLFSKYFKFGFARLISKVAMNLHCLFSKETKGVWMSMQYTSKYLQPLLPKIPGKYDMGIMFLGVADTLINKVNCKTRLTWSHTDYDELFPNKKMDIETYKKVDYVISVSDDCTHKVLKFYPSLKNKAITIENILATSLIIDSSNEKIFDIEKTSSQIILSSIGRYSDQKNFDNVPNICKRILEKGLNVKWYIIGYGGDEQLIKDKIIEEHMENNVILLGKKTNPYPYIKTCDFYVQPSRYEGKCVAVREAQILKKPVIITNYATASSQLTNGYDGVVVDMDNEGCAQGIVDFINNKELQQTIIKNLKKNDYSNSSEVEKIYQLMGD